jgi:ribosome-binding protein aMBF1 (putative translation factor)
MSYRAWLEEQLASDPELRAEYYRLQREAAFRRALMDARLSAGVTQEQLAACIGTKQPAIARLEAGDRQPTVPMIQKLAAALNVSFEFLPTGEVLVHPVPAAQGERTPAVTEPAEVGVSET